MISLRDVADYAGVSTMTVSNVVNGRAGVSVATRQVVEEAIRKLGYRPNLSARHLAKGRTGIITLAIPEVEIPYFAEISSAMMREADRRSMGILVDQTGWDRDRELALTQGALSRLADAVLLYPSTLTQQDLEVARAGVPLVLFGGSEVFTSTDHVVIDNIAAAELATEHLISLGHSRIALIGPHVEPHSSKPNGRLVGYDRALRAAGIDRDPDLVVNVGSYHREDGHRAMRRLLDLPARPTAVFCLSDLLAIGAMRAAHQAGVDVPGALSVVGFDDVREGHYATPPLTTVRPDKAAIAEHSLDLVMERVEHATLDEPPRAVIVGHELIVRDSTSQPV